MQYAQPGSPEASSVCDQIAKLAMGGQEGESDRTRFTILTKVRGGEGILSVTCSLRGHLSTRTDTECSKVTRREYIGNKRYDAAALVGGTQSRQKDTSHRSLVFWWFKSSLGV